MNRCRKIHVYVIVCAFVYMYCTCTCTTCTCTLCTCQCTASLLCSPPPSAQSMRQPCSKPSHPSRRPISLVLSLASSMLSTSCSRLYPEGHPERMTSTLPSKSSTGQDREGHTVLYTCKRAVHVHVCVCMYMFM